MACPCVSQAVCHSATTASVVWPLALDFIFTRCVCPLPLNFNIGCCANEKPLRLIAHRRVRFFRLCLYQHWYWGKGGNSSNPIQASENIMILETNGCTSSVTNCLWKLKVRMFKLWRVKMCKCSAPKRATSSTCTNTCTLSR